MRRPVAACRPVAGRDWSLRYATKQGDQSIYETVLHLATALVRGDSVALRRLVYTWATALLATALLAVLLSCGDWSIHGE